MFIFLYLAFFKDESKIEAKKKIALKNQNVINLKEITKATDPLSKNKGDENEVEKIIDKVNEKINEITEAQNEDKEIENANDVDSEINKENTKQYQEVEEDVDNEMNNEDVEQYQKVEDENNLNNDEDVMIEEDETKQEVFKEEEPLDKNDDNTKELFSENENTGDNNGEAEQQPNIDINENLKPQDADTNSGTPNQKTTKTLPEIKRDSFYEKTFFKLYHDGSNYRDGDDPNGVECPVPWKWVDNIEESDIIALTSR